MYKILFFSGGVYRFDEMVEMVEDIGGMVLKKDYFYRTRGSSYLSEEVHVTLIVPENDEKTLESMSKDIKGSIEESELEDADKNILLTFIPTYDVLSRAENWLTAEEIQNMIECPCGALLCRESGIKSCVLDELDEGLEKLCIQDIVRSREIDGHKEYCLTDKTDDNEDTKET